MAKSKLPLIEEINTEELDLSIILVEDPKSGGYTSFFKNRPAIISEGENKKEAIQNLLRALDDVIESWLDHHINDLIESWSIKNKNK